MLFLLVVCLSLLAAAPAPPSRGLKITERHGGPQGSSSETTEYVQEDRKRYEFRNEGGPRIALITRCDRGRVYELNLDSRSYHWSPLPDYPTLEQWQAAAKRAAAKPPAKRAVAAAPTRLIETTTVDTGERRMMFGHQARHVITTTKETWLRGATDDTEHRELAAEGRRGAWVTIQSYHSDSTSVTDGWYIDLDAVVQDPLVLACHPWWQSLQARNVSLDSYLTDGSSRDVPAFKNVGKRETGRPLQTATTIRSTAMLPDGTRHEHVSTFGMEVTELSEGPLDPALFEPPPGFHHDWTVSLQAEMNWTWQRLREAVARLFY